MRRAFAAAVALVASACSSSVVGTMTTQAESDASAPPSSRPGDEDADEDAGHADLDASDTLDAGADAGPQVNPRCTRHAPFDPWCASPEAGVPPGLPFGYVCDGGAATYPFVGCSSSYPGEWCCPEAR